MASESPWVVLAERLDIITFCDGTVDGECCGFSGDHSYECSGYLNDHRVQSLLVGETLRVAWAHAIEHGKTQEYILTVDMVTQSNPKFLAEHCLRLLGAVNYELSS